MYTVTIDDERLREIVRRLIEAVDPDRIVMFGSRARGDARPDSDLDLLIIKDSSEPRRRRAIPAYHALAGLGIPTDILWRTADEIAEWERVPNHVTTRAIREGKVLYERAA
jgi:predicted nucleotidyltransferase